MIGDLSYPDAGFLQHLTRHRLFQALARFDEAGQRRIHPRWEARLAPQQAAIAVMHQHDHGRIGLGGNAAWRIPIGAAPIWPASALTVG